MTEYIYKDKNHTSTYVSKFYYESGRIKHEASVVDSKFVGVKKTFYETGIVQRVETLFQPTPLDSEKYDCRIVNYWENGAKESEYQYINDKLSGPAIDYDSTGKKTREAVYRDGKLNGTSIIYFPNGKIRSIVECRNDLAYGFEYEFNEKGDTLNADVHYGLSVGGVFRKKWLRNQTILTCSYGDSDRTYVIWRWFDKNRKEIKSKIDRGTLVDNTTRRFIDPE